MRTAAYTTASLQPDPATGGAGKTDTPAGLSDETTVGRIRAGDEARPHLLDTGPWDGFDLAHDKLRHVRHLTDGAPSVPETAWASRMPGGA